MDCGHIIEYTAMDIYMGLDDNEANEGKQVAIKLKECPKCRTPIRKNLRYGAQINRSLREIEMVKEKINGQQTDIKKQRQTLLAQWDQNLVTYDMYDQVEYMQIENRLEESYLSANDLWVVENKMDFLIRVKKILKTEKNMLHPDGSELRRKVEEFVSWLASRHQKFTDQQVFDLQRELQRLNLLAELNARCYNANQRGITEKIQSEVDQMRGVLEMCGQFTEQDEERVKEAMKELDEKVPLEGLGISDEERKMIVSAMKMQLGHWHKCPNGHVYVITECGGAMESRTCPDCDATIGGQDHRLASGNQVASEMDGAQHTAWSEANNLLNFDPLEF